MKLNLKLLQQFTDENGDVDLDAAREFARKHQEEPIKKFNAFIGRDKSPEIAMDYPEETVEKKLAQEEEITSFRESQYRHNSNLSDYDKNNLFYKDVEHMYRDPESIVKAIQEKDFSKLLSIRSFMCPRIYESKSRLDDSESPNKSPLDSQLQRLIEARKAAGKPIRDTEGYAKVLTGQMSYGEYLRDEKNKPMLINQRRHQLIRNFIGISDTMLYSHSSLNFSFSSLRCLYEYITLNFREVEELWKDKAASVSLSFPKQFIWIHNAAHLISKDPIYSDMAKALGIPNNKIDNLCILLTMIEIFRVSKIGTGSVVYAYVREGILNKYLTPLKRPCQYNDFNGRLVDNLFDWLYTNVPAGLDDLKDYLNQLQKKFNYLDNLASIIDLINPYFKSMLFVRVKNWVVNNISHLINGSITCKTIRDYETNTLDIRFGVGKYKDCFCSPYWTHYNTIHMTDLLEILDAPKSMISEYDFLADNSNRYQDKTKSAESFFTELLQLLDERIR